MDVNGWVERFGGVVWKGGLGQRSRVECDVYYDGSIVVYG